MAKEIRKPDFVWLNGEFIPFDEARVHLLSPCARYGINVFEGLRAYWNDEVRQLYAFRLREHYVRLAESMKMMRLQIPQSIEDNIKILIETFQKNNLREDCHIRHVVYVDGFEGYYSTEPVGMLVCALPTGRFLNIEEGITATISSWRRIDDNSIPARIKAGSNYQNSRLATMWAKKDGYDQPIILNADGKVAEGPGSCFFMVRKGIVLTPPVTAGILESVTRDSLIQLISEELRLPMEVRDIDRTEVYVAEEAFLCGSGYEVTPINSVDRLPLGEGKPGPITRRIQKAYFDIARGRSPKYPEWRTAVY
ncbi:MAG: branched-chain amino acid transaminase [Deltaproteobacteria bacterium]|nr:branched-chain amino acid transaminase [Deltaproteobacteria bacterium]